ncbi:hypothetical protein ARMGADRAFT_1065978 [Armillaria gallica]|uniref:Uncharacterized protein n=1 Tax=Armillaria gallica TaxID=47427 RepID=A0A2H3DEC4_ARMGA|nr:hypothetical protein ARMGADRAFT_1065978 [Armillaria gallica]
MPSPLPELGKRDESPATFIEFWDKAVKAALAVGDRRKSREIDVEGDIESVEFNYYLGRIMLNRKPINLARFGRCLRSLVVVMRKASKIVIGTMRLSMSRIAAAYSSLPTQLDYPDVRKCSRHVNLVVSPRQTDDTHLLRKGGCMLSTDHWTIPGDLVGRTVFKPRKDRGSFEVVWSIMNALIGTQVIASKTQMNASSQGSLAKFSWPHYLVFRPQAQASTNRRVNVAVFCLKIFSSLCCCVKTDQPNVPTWRAATPL